MKKMRWGILGTAGIARKNWRAIRDSGNSIISAVASRDIGRSRNFVRECQGELPFDAEPEMLGSYEELIASPDVDAIYVPLPTGLRKEWVLRAASAGKHVLCEKPCGLRAADVREMIEACRKNRVQFMDGVMFMHNPRLNRVRELLDDGAGIGRVKRITSIFTFRATDEFFGANIRLHSELEPTGCLGDLGWYCIRIALWTMNWKQPREVTGRVLSQRGNASSPAPAPTDFSGELIFDDDTSAGFYCSFLVENQQWVDISGEKGNLRIADFVHPFSIHEPAFEWNRHEVRVKCCDCESDHSDSKFVAQDSAMFRNFANQARSGKLNEDWPEVALKTQQVLDACMESARNGMRPVLLD
jgi:predicted dehydrogenase